MTARSRLIEGRTGFAFKPPRGTERLCDALGMATTVIAVLLACRGPIAASADWLALLVRPRFASTKNTWGGDDFLLSQYLTYVLIVVLICIASFVYASLARRLRHRRWWIGVIGLTTLGSVVSAFTISAVLACVTLAVIVVTSVLLAGAAFPDSRPASPIVRADAERVTCAAVLVCEVIAFSWASWLVVTPRDYGTCVLLPAALALAFAVQAAVAETDGDRLRRWAVAGSPALALVGLGLVRAPSPFWLLATVCLVLVLHVALRARTIRGKMSDVLFAAALTAIGTIFITPLQFRELPNVNWSSHEAQHMGWINSIFHGKWMGADAGLTYGVLREYLLAAYCAVFGVTLEHVRVAHILTNIVGYFLIVFASAKLIEPRHFLLRLWLAYLALYYTPLRTLCDFDLTYVSLGWTDAVRDMVATLAVLGACWTLSRGRIGRPSRQAAIAIAGWGFLAGLSTLYSQEFGVCAIVTGAVVCVVDCWVHRERERPRSAVRSMTSLTTAFMAGALTPICIAMTIYSVFGKARLWIQSSLGTFVSVASGAFGSLPYPITEKSFREPGTLMKGFVEGSYLFKNRIHEPDLQFLVPPALYALGICILVHRAINRRWRESSTTLLGLTILGALSFRVTMARAELYHLLSASTPAVLCLGVIARDAVAFRPRTARRSLPLGRACVALLVLVSIVITERIGGMAYQVDVISQGIKAPSGPVRHEFPDLPRVGDVNVDPDVLALVRFLRAHTVPNDPIFFAGYMMDGGQYYFLSDRANPTRYDLLAEIQNDDQRDEVLHSLERNPPVLVVGDDGTIVGPAVTAYLRAGWPVTYQVGSFTVRARGP